MESTSKEPKHVHYTDLFRKWDIRIFLLMVGVIFFWTFFFLPDPVIEWVASRIGVAKIVGGPVFTLVTSAALAVTFWRFLIGDPLPDGNWKASVFFRGEYPSHRIAEKHGIEHAYARQLFLSYYDCWQFDTEPQHHMYLETTRAHYRCSFVFLLRPLLLLLSGLGLVLLFFHRGYLGLPWPAIAAQAIVFLVFAMCGAVLVSFNRLPIEGRRNATGCWAAWRRRCEENYQEFQAALGGGSPEDFHQAMRARLEGLRETAQGERGEEMEKAHGARPIAVTDVETTGLDPEVHEILEIGLVLIDGDSLEAVDTLDLKVRPEHIETASEAALRLNGYDEADWKDAVRLGEAMALYGEKTAGAIFCAHNVTFDWSFIREAFRKTGVENRMDYHRLDLLTMAWLGLRRRGLDRWSLKRIAAFLGVPEEPLPHRAIHGARTAHEVLKRLASARG